MKTQRKRELVYRSYLSDEVRNTNEHERANMNKIANVLVISVSFYESNAQERVRVRIIHDVFKQLLFINTQQKCSRRRN